MKIASHAPRIDDTKLIENFKVVLLLICNAICFLFRFLQKFLLCYGGGNMAFSTVKTYVKALLMTADACQINLLGLLDSDCRQKVIYTIMNNKLVCL